MTNAQIHANFLSENWRALSAGAKKGYRLAGRGAFFVNVVKMIIGNMSPLAVVAYMPDQSTPWPNAKVEKLVTEYNPEKEIAVFFLDPTEGIVAYKAFTDQKEVRLVEY
jgi:hypothetical protein